MRSTKDFLSPKWEQRGFWFLLGAMLMIGLTISLVWGPVDSQSWFSSPVLTPPGLYPVKYTPTPRPSPVLQFTFVTPTPTSSATFPPTPTSASTPSSIPALPQ